MKAKKMLSLMAAVMILLATMAGVAQAVPSPTGTTVVAGSNNIRSLALAALRSERIEAELNSAASEFAATTFADDPEFAGGYDLVPLVTAELRVVITNNRPATVRMNVAGARAGSRIFVVIRLPNGKTSIQEVVVNDDGVIEFTVTGNCTISVLQVVKKGESSNAKATLPATSNR